MADQVLNPTDKNLSTRLQMLAAEKKSCILHLQAKQDVGILFMHNGILLNGQVWLLNETESEHQNGRKLFREEAIIEMLRWEEPRIRYSRLSRSVDRVITTSLEDLLLESSRLEHERSSGKTEDVNAPDAPIGCNDNADVNGRETQESRVATEDAFAVLEADKRIQGFLVINAKGKIIKERKRTRCLNPDFLAFVNFTFNRDVELLRQAYPTHHLHFTMEGGESVLVYCSEKNVFGFCIDQGAEIEGVGKAIAPVLSEMERWQ